MKDIFAVKDYKEYDKIKTKAYVVQWLGKLSDLPDEILDNNTIAFNSQTKSLVFSFKVNTSTLALNDYIAKDEDGNFFKIAFKDLAIDYQEKE